MTPATWTAPSSVCLTRSLACRPIPDKSSYERYLAVLRLLQRRDRALADTFEDLRRSTEMRQLALIPSQELLREEEFGRFSSQTGGAVPILLGV